MSHFQECFVFSAYTSQMQFGQCREWQDKAPCRSCSALSNCTSCLRTLGCGWCHGADSPIHGTCVSGDWTQPQPGRTLFPQPQFPLTNTIFRLLSGEFFMGVWRVSGRGRVRPRSARVPPGGHVPQHAWRLRVRVSARFRGRRTARMQTHLRPRVCPRTLWRRSRLRVRLPPRLDRRRLQSVVRLQRTRLLRTRAWTLRRVRSLHCRTHVSVAFL